MIDVQGSSEVISGSIWLWISSKYSCTNRPRRNIVIAIANIDKTDVAYDHSS